MSRRASLALVFVCLAPSAVFAASPSQQLQNAAPPSMQVAMDEDGQLRMPTAVEMRQLELPSRPGRPLTAAFYSNGMMTVTLDESFDHAFVAHDAEGSLTFTCTDDHAAISALMTSAVPHDTILRVRPSNRVVTAERE